MVGQKRGRRGKWLRVTVVVVAIGLHALDGNSAQAAAIDTSAKPDVVLAGFTAQHFPVFFKIAGERRMLLDGGIAISMTCTSGAIVVVPDTFTRVRIHANGRLHASFASPTIVQNGTTYSATDSLTAKLATGRAQLSGVWRLAVNYSFADGTSDQCDSGPVRFKLTSS